MSAQYHSSSLSPRESLFQKHDDDVVIVSAIRTALTKGGRGGFKDTYPEEYLAAVLKEVYTRANLDPALIEDIAVGNVCPPGGGANAARMAGFAAGIPYTAALNTVNRQCSSGLAAVNQIANEIRAGEIDIGIGSGVESMSMFYGQGMFPSGWSESVLSHPLAADCLVPMGITSENVAERYGVTRQDQDAFGAESMQKAVKALKAGLFKDEILPIKTKWVDPKTKETKEIVVDWDDGIREGVTPEVLAKLKPAFKANGTTTAGTASQVSDGAAAVLLARRNVAKKLGLPILGKFVAGVAVGVPPDIMGVGPVFAIPKVLEKSAKGLTVNDVDVFEINEAFASQALHVVRTLGIDSKKVNPQGGAIGIGHPLGATGARQIVTGLARTKRTGEKVIVTSMCIGSGMGMASLIVNEQN
ncbi:Thiolase, N-terminal domain-containing protein [Cantharellus anzutake]|uniref:Thiolase, N-terminal domain-containing protein n=1 Tax=Cantharellus anzutake TaxID=1750568 RepID=UPI001902EC9D|nr:Thiolase, N-terminal domain-containing protein [Cantharellus anzutake]KAF8323468.1 Thiolase, N-terminal domain-containing protein [Cantharellus anzutake]